MNDLVQFITVDEIAVITINNPPVNALSPGVPEGIAAAIEKISGDDNIKAGVLIGGGRTFIAGADIKQFAKMVSGEVKRDPAGLNVLLTPIEQCSKPIVAAIHGTAFGGGLEISMACHARVAVASAQVGQPEVKLGIIPGAGGTQRLPRLAGVPKAVEMCATGDPVKAPEAHKLGIIDRIIEGDLLEGAIAYARELVAKGEPLRRTCDLTDKLGDEKTNAMIFAMARQMAAKKAKGMMSPLRAIDAVEAATKLPFDEGIKREGEIFTECLRSPESSAMIHVFFGERAVSKVPGIPADTPIKEIKSVGVLGGGTMGGGIAMVYANAGIPVVLKETKQEFLDRGMGIIEGNYAARVKKGRMTQEKMDGLMALITPTLDYADFADVDIVVEAVFEDMEIKKSVFAELDKATRPDCILASNTSTLDVDQIAAATSRPQQVIGHHFFSPANVMRLLEIVRGSESSDEVIATSLKLSRKLRKVGVLVGNCPGFVGNRMIGIYSREAQFLVEEGATPAQVDKALEDFGMAMGPFRMSDLAGVDVSWRVKQGNQHLIPSGQRQSNIIDKLYEAGRYGQKTSKGWYRYEEGSRKAIVDDEVLKMIEASAAEARITRREISDEEIIERLVYGLVNEGAKILDEGFAARAVDIDIIYIFGYGFPPFRGGPMWHASAVGLQKVADRIAEFEKEHGEMWKCSELLTRLATEGKTFEQFDKEKTEQLAGV